MNAYSSPSPSFSALLLGGANSGKTACSLAWARRLANINEGNKVRGGGGEKPLYLATAALPADATSENYARWQRRIAKHRAERGDMFETLEQPDHLALVPSLEEAKARVIVVDCLTLFLSSLLFCEGVERMDKQEALFERLTQDLEMALPALALSGKSVLLVSNEVGLGVVPYTKMGDTFRGFAGILHQRMAACVETLALVIAGVPMIVKGSAP